MIPGQIILITVIWGLVAFLLVRTKKRENTPLKKEPFGVNSWQELTCGKTPIAKWINSDQDELVFLTKLNNGTYSCCSFQYESDEYCDCWIPCDGDSFFDSEETAIREINVMWPWTKTVEIINKTPNQGMDLTRENAQSVVPND